MTPNCALLGMQTIYAKFEKSPKFMLNKDIDHILSHDNIWINDLFNHKCSPFSQFYHELSN